MKFNRKLALVLALVLSIAAATTGTLAYLTDRDSTANVFTMGNVKIELSEDFEQGVTILPGQTVEKAPSIKNTGSVDAYVWMEVAVPTTMSVHATLGNDVLMYNNTYHEEIGSTINGWTLVSDNFHDKVNTGLTTQIDGKEYVVFTYTTIKSFVSANAEKGVLKAGESTGAFLFDKVAMSKYVDITPDGDMYLVKNGETTSLDWNINTDGNPVIYVSAYAIQTQGFANVKEAYDAYHAQWGNKGTEWGSTTITVEPDTSWYDNNKDATEYSISTAAELFGLAKLVNSKTTNFNDKTIKLTADIDLHDQPWTPIGQTDAHTEFKGAFNGGNHTITGLNINTGSDASTKYAAGLFGWVGIGGAGMGTIENLTIDGASVTGGQYVGAIVGYLQFGTVKNCTVKNSKIKAVHYSNNQCGSKAGALIGFCAPNNPDKLIYVSVIDSSAENCTVTAARDAGQVIGAAYVKSQNKNTIDNCTATNVTVTADTTGCTDTDAGANITNDIVGRSI